MIKSLALLLTLLFWFSAYSQIENNNWYFGTGTDGIAFTGNGPVKLNNKAAGVGFEGMIVVNDPITGELRFYSDGQKVVNKNHAVMTNGYGLTGHMSGAQCVQCCPVPGTCAKKFYLFTNSAYDLITGHLSYSIIDFTIDPLGEVTNKNTLLWSGNCDEGMCLVNKPNTNDYWLIVNEDKSATYYIWPLTGAGIGTPQTQTFAVTGATMIISFSKVAQKISATGYGNRAITLIDFNPNTGTLSNEVNLGAAYGNFTSTRFSPDGTKLYSARTDTRSLYQYDFNTSTFTDMGTCCYAHDLKMGPDGKMYHIHTYNDAQPMAVIDFPDSSAIGNACNYHKITFIPAFTGEVRRFPEIVQLPIPPIALADSVDIIAPTMDVAVLGNDYDLQGDMITLDAIVTPPQWGTATITDNKITYQFTALQRCKVRDSLIYRIRDNNCDADTAIVIFKHEGAPIRTSHSESICEDHNYQGYTTTGTYIDTFTTANGCDSIRTLHLTVLAKSFSYISPVICEGQVFAGHATTGIYKDTVVATNGCDSIRTINLIVRPHIRTTFTPVICEGLSYAGYMTTGHYIDTFPASNSCDSIRTLILTVIPRIRTIIDTAICQGNDYRGYTTTGTYIDTFVAVNTCDSIRTLHLTVINLPSPYLGMDTVICSGTTFIMTPGEFKSYLWQDGSSGSSYTVTQGGVYQVAVTNACGDAYAARLIMEKACNIYFPSGFTPNKDGRNDEFKILTEYPVSNYHLLIYNRWGQKVFDATDPQKGWDGNIGGKLSDPGVYIWYAEFTKNKTPFKMRGTVVLIR